MLSPVRLSGVTTYKLKKLRCSDQKDNANKRFCASFAVFAQKGNVAHALHYYVRGDCGRRGYKAKVSSCVFFASPHPACVNQSSPLPSVFCIAVVI